MRLSEFKPSKNLSEAFTIYDKDPEPIFAAFKASYEAETGTAWSKEKFISRARNWTFYGDDKGFVAVRVQGSGMKKLVGVAGDGKSILRGLAELQNEGGPIWGAVSGDLAKMAKKRGMIVPHTVMGGPTFIKMLLGSIPSSVFGGVTPKVAADGGIVLDYEDVGTATKYLIGNKEYFLQAMKVPQVAEKLKSIPGVQMVLKMMGL